MTGSAPEYAFETATGGKNRSGPCAAGAVGGAAAQPASTRARTTSDGPRTRRSTGRAADERDARNRLAAGREGRGHDLEGPTPITTTRVRTCELVPKDASFGRARCAFR